MLTDPSRGGVAEVGAVAGLWLEQAYGLWLCERLGHPEERVQRLAPAAALPADLILHLVVLLAEQPEPQPPESCRSWGQADGAYLQHPDRPGLMTKREVRIQLLADLECRPPECSGIWGRVGSIGLEACAAPRPFLWRSSRWSAALIGANAERLGVSPAGVIEGRAPEALVDLPNPDRVLIGGGGRDRVALLEAVLHG